MVRSDVDAIIQSGVIVDTAWKACIELYKRKFHETEKIQKDRFKNNEALKNKGIAEKTLFTVDKIYIAYATDDTDKYNIKKLTQACYICWS